MAKETQAHGSDWSPAKPGKDGVFFDEHELPLNHRLRAEALARAGADKDPGNQVTPEMITDTAARLQAEAEAEKPNTKRATAQAPADEGKAGQ